MATNPDYAARTLKSWRTFLDRWRGTTARIRELTRSHQTLCMELTRAGDPDQWLEIACIDPSLIHAPISCRTPICA